MMVGPKGRKNTSYRIRAAEGGMFHTGLSLVETLAAKASDISFTAFLLASRNLKIPCRHQRMKWRRTW